MLIQARDENPGIALDLTPMIDMVFLLLIFFLVATSFQQDEREMQVALPFANSAGPISAALREIVINVDADGRIVVAGRTMTPDALAEMIHQAVASNPEQKVSVRGDRATPWANVVRVLDVCKKNGIQEPYLDTILGE
ncbi:MAG: biopolymer transporter ExbD [Phycisphaerae bacterium]|nr:biopolymer transporter ExbD [Phycisphaerae bacterium]NUQ45051.1 biopolymer transporter ExbD [Phycisphaerae bacterium]